MKNIVLIGMPGSGKSTCGVVAAKLLLKNFFDTDLLIRHLQELKAGRSIQCPVYSFVEHNRTDQTVEIQPAKVIIVEGILI